MSADLILTADWHIRERAPVAWVGDYWTAQEEALAFLSNLQREEGCPIVVAGDVFDRPCPSFFLVSWLFENLPQGEIFVVPGQHDLPHHRADKIDRSALMVFEHSNRMSLIDNGGWDVASFKPLVNLYGFWWGSDFRIRGRRVPESKRRIAVAHVMTYVNEAPYPGCTADPASKLMEKLDGFDLILTGDNHEPFVVKKGKRILVNPGSLMRITAAQIDHRPRVYLWYAKTNTVKPVYLPIRKEDVTREHIESREDHDERIEAFVERLKGDVEIGLSFEENLREFLDKNKTKEDVKKIVWEVVG